MRRITGFFFTFMNKSEALQSIVAQARMGELVFPANVQASLTIQEALDAPDCGIEDAARLVLKDPLMAARVVAIANSVAYNRFGGGVTNIRTAITILGFSTLRSVITSVVMKQISQAVHDPDIRASMDALWQHSAQVGAIAHLLARKFTQIDPETALFAGIVHEIGGFYLLSRAEQFPALLEPDTVAADGMQTDSEQTVIGRAVLHKLLVPKRIITAIETLWSGLRETPAANLGDMLFLANLLSTAPSPLDLRTAQERTQAIQLIDHEFELPLSQVMADAAGELASLVYSLTS